MPAHKAKDFLTNNAKNLTHTINKLHPHYSIWDTQKGHDPMAFEDEENEHDLRISDSALEQKKSIDAMDKRVDK